MLDHISNGAELLWLLAPTTTTTSTQRRTTTTTTMPLCHQAERRIDTLISQSRGHRHKVKEKTNV
jgi:hypothetical protein